MHRTLVATCCLLAVPALAKPLIVQVSAANAGCRYDLALNGVPLTKGETSDVFSLPVNPWLQGQDNALEASVTAKADTCRLELTVVEVDQGAGRTRELVTGAVDAKAKTATLPFASAVDALSAWKAAAPWKDQAALRAYAVQLVNLARAGKADAWLEEVAPKVDQLAAAFRADRAVLVAAEREGLKDFAKVLPPLAAKDVVVEPLLDGRLWRLRNPAHPRALFVVKQGDEVRAMEIVVGAVDGKLRVVR